MPSKYPPGENPPPPLTKGPGHENLNDRFEYIYSMLDLPADPSITKTPGTASSPGRIRATAQGGGGPAAKIPDFTIVSAVDSAHPRRVRVYNGTLGGLTPAEMQLPDAILPDGTDNHCYLTAQPGFNHAYQQVLLDATTGEPTAAHVALAPAVPPPDATSVYQAFGAVIVDGTSLTIQQSDDQTGSKKIYLDASADGTVLHAIFL